MTEMRNIKIKDVMQPSPKSIGTGQNLLTAAKIMKEMRIRHLPVKKGGELVGILSERDISTAQASKKLELDQILISEVYIEEPFQFEPDVSLHSVVTRMAEEKIGSALIVREEELLGIFTTTDACTTLASLLDGSLEKKLDNK
jgi:acetoin utilization protein AcuB